LILWVDAHISPDLAFWITDHFNLEARPVRDLGLGNAKDQDIFFAARKSNAAVMTKDSDFLVLLDRHGPPPQLIWLTCGNTSNTRLREILQATFEQTIQWLKSGERLIEIGDIPPAIPRR